MKGNESGEEVQKGTAAVTAAAAEAAQGSAITLDGEITVGLTRATAAAIKGLAG